jgi:hypothetical protein
MAPLPRLIVSNARLMSGSKPKSNESLVFFANKMLMYAVNL